MMNYTSALSELEVVRELTIHCHPFRPPTPAILLRAKPKIPPKAPARTAPPKNTATRLLISSYLGQSCPRSLYTFDLLFGTIQSGRSSILGKDRLQRYQGRIEERGGIRSSWPNPLEMSAHPESGVGRDRHELKVWNKAQQIMVAGIHREGLNFLRTKLDGTSKAT